MEEGEFSEAREDLAACSRERLRRSRSIDTANEEGEEEEEEEG